jgi:DNA-binding NtrC family response regulator
MAAAGQFRPDLFYRLSVITLDLPPLREREGDVDVLVAHFLRSSASEGNLAYRLTREAAAALRSYSFPGNVRELENAIRRAIALCPNEVITLDCLPPEIATTFGNEKESSSYRDERTIISDRPTIDELQRRYLELVLDENNGKKTRAAAVLGLDRRTVQRLVAKYRLPSACEDENEDAEKETSENMHGGDS